VKLKNIQSSICNVLHEPPWYGTVCPVVWEDGGSNPASYPMLLVGKYGLFDSHYLKIIEIMVIVYVKVCGSNVIIYRRSLV